MIDHCPYILCLENSFNLKVWEGYHDPGMPGSLTGKPLKIRLPDELKGTVQNHEITSSELEQGEASGALEQTAQKYTHKLLVCC